MEVNTEQVDSENSSATICAKTSITAESTSLHYNYPQSARSKARWGKKNIAHCLFRFVSESVYSDVPRIKGSY